MTILYKAYTKTELLEICRELGISKFSNSSTSKQLAHIIASDLDSNGIPPDDECSDLLYDFIRDGGWVDDDDDNDDDDNDADDSNEVVDAVVDAVVDPLLIAQNISHFGFYDSRDPACGKCALMEACKAERARIREYELPCYGLMYSSVEEECKLCLEAGSCRTLTEQRNM